MKSLKKFWLKNESKIVIILATILIAVFSWEAGVLQGQKWQAQPIVIEKPVAPVLVKKADGGKETSNHYLAENKIDGKVKRSETQFSEKNNSLDQNKECAFVGSKNSNKYHYPTCRWVKRIKPANRVCFKNAEEARQRGYVPASCISKKR